MAKEIEEASAAQTAEPMGYAEDVRNDVAKAIQSLKGDPEPEKAEVKDEHPEPVDHPEKADALSDGRARDATGKFVAKDKVEAAPEKVEAPQEIPSTDTTKASTPAVSTPQSAPPAGWTAAEKAEWSKLSPAVQAAVSRREAEISRGGQQWSEEKRRFEGMLAPVAQAAQRRGMSAEQGLNALIAAQDRLDRDPAEAIAWLAKSYGVDLATLASNPPAEQTRSDPMVSQLSQHISVLESRLSGFLQNQTMGVVEKFASEHPHYAAVESDIAQLIPMIQQAEPGLNPSDVLSKAYERAIWLNPDVRSQLIKEQTETAQKQQMETIQAKAQKASKAAVSVKGSSNGAAPMPKAPPSGGDVYDDVRNAINQLRQH